ncbi:RNase P modulator RnpM [Dendrosporobacter sp. 1207_IL3150]|uniref:RNase P modulator RnpM n=1 Tax=Dendrosporobacter sp. 1207_IL3150 TaxID=3084054 RepID=UPI003FA57129
MVQKKIPQRMCVGCQEMKNKKELMRIVRTPEAEIVLDSTGKKAGRGAYVCRNEQCFAKAFKEKRLERALKHAVDPEVYEQLRSGIMNK